jgi:hypothetical protein
MSQTDYILTDPFGSGLALWLLYGAIGLVVVFVGLLLCDHFLGTRQRQHDRRRLPRLTLRQRVAGFFSQLQELVQMLKKSARQRARRRERAERIARQMRRISK